ncbi:valine--tRNA ligase, partial [Saliniramus sp.]|uniref:valine--tRNA ligase n=1 Tax=Saliniramus sp. TaxID=2986772 RepID=UPI002B7081CB
MMDKTFDPAAVEARIAARWNDAGAFRAGRPERKDAKPYTIVIPPPNVTGSLHMGHALNNTIQDILCRFERMRGRDVLWQPGTDHAGIATQMVVERKLAAEGRPDRRSLGREKFLEEVWAFKEESGGRIRRQLERIGASCDWSRERFTMDDGLSKAVLRFFVELYRQGLMYRDKRLVNWDPKFQTAISDLEVQQLEIKGHLWHFRYPIEDEPGRFITVATTRPETMLGDTGIAVHPGDERYKDLVGKHVILPLVGRRIPIVADEYSDPEIGSGAVKMTPAHDFNDFEVGKRQNLRMVNIFDPEARIWLEGNMDFHVDLPDSPDLTETMTLHGLDRFEARKRIVAMMEARELLAAIEPNTHTVPHGDRSGVPIEPYLTDQWYVDVKPLAEKAMTAVRDGRTSFVPNNWEKTYFQWLENIEPWCVSRQLWWGHQIPAWYDEDGNVFVAYDEAEAQAQAREKNGHDVPLRRDEDVLDTWFSSALWPFSTLGWPDETPELKRYYPTDVLVTGFDIIFFWVARMMMTGLHFMQDVPFRDVYIHALVRDDQGRKMSKSLGNIIDPLTLIDAYGADAVRMTLASM